MKSTYATVERVESTQTGNLAFFTQLMESNWTTPERIKAGLIQKDYSVLRVSHSSGCAITIKIFFI